MCIRDRSVFRGELSCGLWVGLGNAVGASVVVGQCDDSLAGDSRIHLVAPGASAADKYAAWIAASAVPPAPPIRGRTA
eukprot:10055824-Alexandrium_andersonii.AAC.1